MKRIGIAFIIILSLAFVSAPAVFAADLDMVTDAADILTVDEWEELNERAEAITAKYECDVAIVILDEMTDDDGAYEWAKFIYQEYDFGYGEDKGGVLLFLSMAERDYSLIAFGYGNTAFTDHGKDVMLDDHILPLLGEDQYYEAFSAYLDKAEEFLKMSREGTPFDVDTDPVNARTAFLIKLAVTILLPLLIALLICSLWKRQMKTAVSARSADNYIPEGGFRLTAQEDLFLYRTENRQKIERSSSGSGGGTTRDSSGFSGRSGKF